MASHQGSSRRPDARTMSRRKQAKPQHINSEEGQGEQPLQQPSPDLAEAPAAEEPGECGCGPVRAPVCSCVREGAPSTAVRPSRARAPGTDFGTGIPDSVPGKERRRGSEGGSLSPPTPRKFPPVLSLLLQSWPPIFLLPHSPTSLILLVLSPIVDSLALKHKHPFTHSNLGLPFPLSGGAAFKRKRPPSLPTLSSTPLGASRRRGAPLGDPPQEGDLLYAPLPGRVGGGGATSPHPQAGVRATRAAQRAGEATWFSSRWELLFYFFVILGISFTFFFSFPPFPRGYAACCRSSP